MRKNKIPIIIVLILAVATVLLWTSKQYTTLAEEESDFKILDTAAVSKIFIADKNVQQVLLERTGSGWVLNNTYQANTYLVDFLLGTMRRLKVKAPVPLSGHDNVVARMAGYGIKVEIYQMVYRINLFNRIKLFRHEKRTKVFYVGDVTQDNMGTYMLMEGSPRPYIVYIQGFRGFVSSRFSPQPDDWKSHVVFNQKLQDIKSVSLQFTKSPEESFKVDVVDEMGNFELTELSTGSPVTYDTLKMLNFLTSFRDLRYETRMNNLLPEFKLDSILQSPSIYELTLVDRNEDTTFLKCYTKAAIPEEIANAYEILVPVDHDRFFAHINEGEDFVLLQYYVFDKVLRPLSYYRQK